MGSDPHVRIIPQECGCEFNLPVQTFATTSMTKGLCGRRRRQGRLLVHPTLLDLNYSSRQFPTCCAESIQSLNELFASRCAR